jgi:hypothetical protein
MGKLNHSPGRQWRDFLSFNSPSWQNGYRGSWWTELPRALVLGWFKLRLPHLGPFLALRLCSWSCAAPDSLCLPSAVAIKRKLPFGQHHSLCGRYAVPRWANDERKAQITRTELRVYHRSFTGKAPRLGHGLQKLGISALGHLKDSLITLINLHGLTYEISFLPDEDIGGDPGGIIRLKSTRTLGTI